MTVETRNLAAATVCAALTIPVTTAVADEHESRQLESHEHGVTELNVALDDDLLYVELDAPAMNFVGFEHPPRTAEQNQAVAETLSALRNPASIFSVSVDANCAVIEADAKHLLGADEHDPPDHSGTNHEEDDDTSGHSEFVASYRLRCANPDKLQALEVELFDAFPLTTEVETSFIGPAVQTFGELTPSSPELLLEP